MLVLYIKFREQNQVAYKTVFAWIVQLAGCSAQHIADAIIKFYIDHWLDLQKMVMLTSDGASVMLGKHNWITAILRRQILHLTEQHCVAQREDLGIEDAWKGVSLMTEVETLLRTVYSLFSRSSVKKSKFDELANVLEVDSLSFRPLNEVSLAVTLPSCKLVFAELQSVNWILHKRSWQRWPNCEILSQKTDWSEVQSCNYCAWRCVERTRSAL